MENVGYKMGQKLQLLRDLLKEEKTTVFSSDQHSLLVQMKNEHSWNHLSSFHN